MEAKELRIGNYVEYNGYESSIYCIQSPFPRKEKRFNNKELVTLMIGGLSTVCVEDVKPIIINKELLLKFGFVYDNNWHYQLGENPLRKDFLIDLTWIEGEEFPFYRNGFFKIKSVNQLQNLYYALTGEELLIKQS